MFNAKEWARSKLIFALDVGSRKEANDYVSRLSSEVGLFKIGKQLFVHAGPDVVRSVRSAGSNVFLDLKFHDIPQTVSAASVEAARLGVQMLTLHASGGPTMLRRTVEAVNGVCQAEKLRRPLLVAVTVLTSLESNDLRLMGIGAGATNQAVRLALIARNAGIDGVVASPHETKSIRDACGTGVKLVTPGVRPQAAEANDQKRVLTPYQAICNGADYLVVGRPIRDAKDPVRAANLITEEMADAAVASKRA